MFPEHSLVGVKCFEAFSPKNGLQGLSALMTIITGETLQGEILVKMGNSQAVI